MASGLHTWYLLAAARVARPTTHHIREATMELAVVGAGVGRTGTHSLKIALEQLLGAPCHHMMEIMGDPSQIPSWIDAIEGRPVDWSAMMTPYRAIVDWPG